MIKLAYGHGRVLALRVSASAVVFDGQRQVLLQQRSDGGQWGLPGGAAEIGERIQDTVVREVREETGLVVRPLRLVGVYSDPKLQVVRYPDGNVWHFVTLCFECRVVRGRLTTCDETLALAYFPMTRLPKTLLPPSSSGPHPRRPRAAHHPVHPVREGPTVGDASITLTRW